MEETNIEQFRQLLDLICDEVNVKSIGLSIKTEKGFVFYCRKTRKMVLEEDIKLN